MDNVSKTLYIPLYGKSYVSRRGLFLQDSMAEKIWEAEGFPLKGKARSKWLAYNMGIRAAVFDRWLKERMAQDPDAVILHIGCGMDGRITRVGNGTQLWFDLDFPEVIAQRRRYYTESETYRMIASDVLDFQWLAQIPTGRRAIIVMEGVSMYLSMDALQQLFSHLGAHFVSLSLLTDSYTVFAAKATRYKNPINEVGVTQVSGFDDPEEPARGTGVGYVRQWELTPDDLIAQLPRGEQGFFKKFFAGKLAKKIYRLYEYAAPIP